MPGKPWNIKLSSAGLVYVHFGREVLAELLRKHLAYDEKLLDKLYDIMYENFIREIDAIDNGIEIAESKKYEITTNLSARVGRFNPVWNETNVDENVLTFFWFGIYLFLFLKTLNYIKRLKRHLELDSNNSNFNENVIFSSLNL